MVDELETLAEIVVANPAAARVFYRYRLDFCCGGKQTLRETCAAKGLDPEVVLREIGAVQPTEGREAARWADRPIPELVQHILDRYHTPLKTGLPGLVELAVKVEHAHADNPERPIGLARLLEEVREAVEEHLEKEEKILFPLILSGRGQLAYMPIQVMMQEHEDHGQNLRRIRELTKDLVVPDGACASWRELYQALEEFETDLMYHIHLENNILFPRVLGA